MKMFKIPNFMNDRAVNNQIMENQSSWEQRIFVCSQFCCFQVTAFA